MAEKDAKDKQDDDDESGAKAKKPFVQNPKKLIVMILLALLIVGASVGGTIMALKMMQPAPVENETATEEGEEKEPPPRPAIYFPLKPPIVVNFNQKGRQRFLQAELTLMTRDDSVIGAIELHMPMIRNALILLIGGQVYSEIQTAEGKELLRQQCLQEIQRLLEKEIGKPGVEQVLFSNFILQ